MEELRHDEYMRLYAPGTSVPMRTSHDSIPSLMSGSSDEKSSFVPLDAASTQPKGVLSLAEYIPVAPQRCADERQYVTGSAALADVWDNIDAQYNELLASLEHGAVADMLAHSVWPPAR